MDSFKILNSTSDGFGWIFRNLCWDMDNEMQGKENLFFKIIHRI